MSANNLPDEFTREQLEGIINYKGAEYPVTVYALAAFALKLWDDLRDSREFNENLMKLNDRTRIELTALKEAVRREREARYGFDSEYEYPEGEARDEFVTARAHTDRLVAGEKE